MNTTTRTITKTTNWSLTIKGWHMAVAVPLACLAGGFLARFGWGVASWVLR